MKICLVGGIFDREEAVRSKHVVTPETVLLDGFRKAGVDVDAVGHAHFSPSDKYDLIHVHHMGKAALKMAASSCRARFVFTGHNGLIVTGYERSWLRRRAFQYVLDKCDAFVALSQAEARYFAGRGAAHKVHCIPNGIPADIFRAAGPGERLEKPADKRCFDILYVGQLIDWKGVHFLLEAFEECRKQGNARLRLVYHNASREAEYRRLVQELGIAEDVDFVGILGPAELAREYHRADLLVLPSFADCLPSVVTEALLCGTPVVAGAVCGVPEQLGKYGYAIPPGNVPALVRAINDVRSQQARFRGMAAEMRSYAEQKYNPQAMVQGHVALYRKMLAQPSELPARQAFWLDPLVRLAIQAYWARSKRAAL